ncbi:MAG: YdcF family protein [Epulopiscium sp.]|jgi:uncharacterized SAM-binding protein YcdF (DUF218 family)|nr:YdcF family protein [Candidatus Epulonipiscium sp.]
MKNKKSKFFIIIGCIALSYSILTCILAHCNIGTLFPGALGIIFCVYGFFYAQFNQWSKKGFGKYFMLYAKFGFYVWLISFLAVTAVLIQNSSKEGPEGADAIIVLGAGLNGADVTPTLAFRLDKAAEYYFSAQKKPVIVVSGGQGSNELVPESYAMKQYLLKCNIPPEMVLEESESHNTRQNFENSKVLLDSYFQSKPYIILYVTNEFHTFRAGKLAKKAGFTASGAGAKSSPYMIANDYFREYFSILKYIALDHFS